MIFRVIFRVSFYEVWKDFTTLFDAANYASEIRGTVFDKDDKACPIKQLRIEFIESEEEKAAPTSADQ